MKAVSTDIGIHRGIITDMDILWKISLQTRTFYEGCHYRLGHFMEDFIT